MSQFKGQFSSIQGLSDVRRLPRLGKLRLGVKVVNQSTGKSYPKETPYFVCPPEVEKVYGPNPTSIRVMLPLNDREAVFPQAYKWYGNSRGLKCIGNGCIARRAMEGGTVEEIECPCEKLKTDANPKGECTRRASLMVMLPEVSLGGVFQIDTSSYHSIVDVNSGIDMILAMTQMHMGFPRVAMLPLCLRRVPRTTHGAGQKAEHYTLQLVLDLDMKRLEALKMEYRPSKKIQYALPPVDEVNPEVDPDARIIYDEEQAPGEGVIEAEKQALAQAEPEAPAPEPEKSTDDLFSAPKEPDNGHLTLLNQIEDNIRKDKVNRMLFLEFLYERNYIELRNEAPYLMSMNADNALKTTGNWKGCMKAFSEWQKKRQG